jgi:hypothetical protein
VVTVFRKEGQDKNLHSPYSNSNQMDFNSLNYNPAIYIVRR